MEKVNVKSNWVRGSCIGRGSFGTVNLAVDKSDGGVFAVKSVEITSGLGFQLEALESEIRILRSISSPHVVEYLGDDTTWAFGTPSCRNLYLEYLPGGTVGELAVRSGAADKNHEMTLRSYTWCIVSALRYLHAKGIVHCDVKGMNVLVGSSPGTAKLADFGSAAQLYDQITPRGSPLWMAPEVVRGEYQGSESDVWSLGCTVIEMITGKPAWEDKGADTLVQIGYSGDTPKFPAQLSELGRDFLEKCLRRERSERWSCDQLLQHPFLLSCSPDEINTTTKWSPRCVFDWSDSNFSDDDDEEDCVIENLDSDVKGKIRKLASKEGANWESDGWVEVRNMVTKKTEEEGGTSWAFLQLIMTEEENAETSRSEYADSIGTEEVSWRVNWEYSDSSGEAEETETKRDHCSNSDSCSSGRCTAGPSCNWESINISYSCCRISILCLLNFLIMYYDHTFMNNIINKQILRVFMLWYCTVTCDESGTFLRSDHGTYCMSSALYGSKLK